MSRLLFELAPALASQLPHVTLGNWPSALDRVEMGSGSFLAKREDLSTNDYAGNKIRPLELVFGRALAEGATEVWATGAWGSNHALATVIHARRAGLAGGALLWPQPRSLTAVDNLRATVATAQNLAWSSSVVTMPAAALWLRERRKALVMAPGAATPYYALGHAEGAVELAHQMQTAGLGDAGTIVLPVGSTCTTVGMLVGTALAAALGLVREAPHIAAVRVTPWPVTAVSRIVRMALEAGAILEGMGAPPLRLTREGLLTRLRVHGGELGAGYGEPTRRGWEAIAAGLDANARLTRIAEGGVDPIARPLRLDTTYSAKAAAFLFDALPTLREPVVFWMTKSAAPLPAPDLARERALPLPVRRFIKGPLSTL